MGVEGGDAAVRPVAAASIFHMLLNRRTEWKVNEPSDWTLIY